MAQSRLEKIGTIFSRITNLRKGGVLKKEEVPLWYAVYKAFPPKYEPRFDRPGSQAPIRNIYYTEDLIRAKFYEYFPRTTIPKLLSDKKTKCQEFIEEYRNLEKEGIPESEIYARLRERFTPTKLDDNHEHSTIKQKTRNINVTNYLKESI